MLHRLAVTLSGVLGLLLAPVALAGNIADDFKKLGLTP